MIRTVLMGLCTLLAAQIQPALGQPGGFGSVSYGYNQSPLNNYEHISDRLIQGYIDLHVIVDALQAPGSHRALFDASGLSSGAYIYRLEVGSSIYVRRMLHVK